MKKISAIISIALTLTLLALIACNDEEESDCTAIDNQLDCEAEEACLWNSETGLCEAVTGEGEPDGDSEDETESADNAESDTEIEIEPDREIEAEIEIEAEVEIEVEAIDQGIGGGYASECKTEYYKSKEADGDIETEGETDNGCPSEMLNWQFDSQTGYLSFDNTDVYLNCCGVHRIYAYDRTADEGPVYEILEIDRLAQPGDEWPDSETLSRCKCTCPYDFSVSFPFSGASSIHLILSRRVSDSDNEGTEGENEIWSGDIDPALGNGSILIAEHDWCE